MRSTEHVSSVFATLTIEQRTRPTDLFYFPWHDIMTRDMSFILVIPRQLKKHHLLTTTPIVHIPYTTEV